MKRALISDVHGNLEALQAVLGDIRAQGITQIICLGDIIGYGPNPRECLDSIIQASRVTILGNHDQAALFDPESFNPVATRAIYWTRRQLEVGGSAAQVNKRWDFLGELPRTYTDGDFLFLHGSPREPTNEYVFPEDIYDQRKMDALFERINKYCFQGHTHIPGVFTIGREFVSPEECNFQFQLTGNKVMVNVGSVGQPRDGDPRSCYVVLDDGRQGPEGPGASSAAQPSSAPVTVTFRRIEYPKEITARKIYNISDLDNMLGDRLLEGR